MRVCLGGVEESWETDSIMTLQLLPDLWEKLWHWQRSQEGKPPPCCCRETHVCESQKTETPSRSLFNYFLSFCPVGLHCEPFNYTIHHLLNMKNGVKHMLIKACPKLAKSSKRAAFMYVRTWRFHSFYLILSSTTMEAQWLWNQVTGWIWRPLLAVAFVLFHFCPVNELKLKWRTRLILLRHPSSSEKP